MPLNLKKLKTFLLDNAGTCIHKPAGQLKHAFVTPTYGVEAGQDDEADVSDRQTLGHYLQMYDWDACFFGQASMRLGLEELPFSIVENFLSFMDRTGYLPRTISPGRIWDGADMCKPFLAQLAWHWSKSTKQAPSADLLEKLRRYLSYFQHERRDELGLFRWRNVLESGADNNLSLIFPLEASKDDNTDMCDFPDGDLLAVDLSAYLAAEYRALSQLASAAGDSAAAATAQHTADEIVARIEAYMWDEERSIYCNISGQSHDRVRVRTWTALTPVFFGLVPADRALELVEKNIMEERHYLRQAGLATVAVSEVLYNQAPRGLYGRFVVSNWQGPVWVLPNVMAVRGLLSYGMEREAEEISRRMVTTLLDDLETTGTLHENYHADTGAPLWAPQFMSWNVLALELIEVLE